MSMNMENKNEIQKEKKTGYRLFLLEDPRQFLRRIYQNAPLDPAAFILRVQKALKENRQQYRLGAAQLGEALELNRQEYKRAENGKLPLDLNQAVFLACLFNAYFEKHPGFRRELILPTGRTSVLELDAMDLAAIANYNMLLAVCDMEENDYGASLVWQLLGSARRNRLQAEKSGLVSLDEYVVAVRAAYGDNPSLLQEAARKQIQAARVLGALQRETLQEQKDLAGLLENLLQQQGGVPASFDSKADKEAFFQKIDSAILEGNSRQTKETAD